MAAAVRDLETLNTEIQQQKEQVENVDFKMITFSLGGKDYGVDIMNVKEIAKADKFTFVPNAASFVKGVYNLRGDIIPIIDLRSFFHLPVQQKDDGIENMLILRIEERVYGTIVDRIDKVVGINSESMQPPHPIFGDINIKFISGVVEKQGSLYIILDVVRIFSQSEDSVRPPDVQSDAYYTPPPIQEKTALPGSTGGESALDFIRESLPALKRFYPSILNDQWIRERFTEWSIGRSGDDLQFKDAAAAEDFLSRFYSPFHAAIWDNEYADLVKAVLPDLSSNNIQAWNIGCGKGYETYSFACVLRARYPDAHIKIWANDNDIMAISQAPNILFDLTDIPEYCRSFMVRGANGYSFNQVIKDSIFFEYHDILNDNQLPELDIILARDVLSFIPVSEQEKLLVQFVEKLKSRNMVFLGRNEELPENEWRSAAKAPVSAFVHKG